MIIKSKKELYEFLPAELQAPKTKQNIGKIFSIAASNYWTGSDVKLKWSN